MASTLLLRRRIRSVKNTHQITRAMELVSAAKMKKSQQAVLATRPYAHAAWKLLERLAPMIHPDQHPLLRYTETPKSITLIVFSSNRGLCGSFNTNIGALVAKRLKELREQFPQAPVSCITVGKKIRDQLKKRGVHIIADIPKPESAITTADIRSIVHIIREAYVKQESDKVEILYTDFVSLLQQKPTVFNILPMPSLANLNNKNHLDTIDRDYLLEPNPDTLVEAILPKLLELELYQALLESNASEHSARRMTMKNATDAASDIIDDLQQIYNQQRQAKITQEIAEIATAAAVMA